MSPHIDFAMRQAALLADLKDLKQLGLHVSQEYVEQLAAEHGVPAPILASLSKDEKAQAQARRALAEAREGWRKSWQAWTVAHKCLERTLRALKDNDHAKAVAAVDDYQVALSRTGLWGGAR